MGSIRLSGGIMLKQFLGALVCGVVFIGKVHAQEVIVAREKKPEVPQTTCPAFGADLLRISDASATQIQVS